MDSDAQFKTALSARLQKLRQERHLTQAELARQCDFPQPLVSLYEKPTSNRLPTLYGIVKLANVLGVSTDYLLGRTKERTGTPLMQPDEAILKDLTSKDRQVVLHIISGLVAAAKAKQEAAKRRKGTLPTQYDKSGKNIP